MVGLFGGKRIYRGGGIDVGQGRLHGHRIVARKAFCRGEVVEICPIVVMPEAEKELLRCTSFFRYYFLIGHPGTPVALGLGYSSLYNHAYSANAAYSVSLRELTLTVKAFRPIREGDEITLNYNGSPDDQSPVWLPEAADPPVHAGPPHGMTGLYVKRTKHKGRGVFCGQLIRQGETIEVSPLLVTPAEDYETVNATLLSNYFFHFDKEEQTMALSLGFGSIYNHAKNSNASYSLSKENRMMTYYALGDIRAGQEICVNYSGETGQDFPEWFQARGIEVA